MEKNRIKKMTGIILLSALIADGIALYDSTIDHTSEICPITKICNIIPNNVESEDGCIIPTGIYVHQIPEMKKDFAEKGIHDCEISYGRVYTKKIDTEIVDPTIVKNEDGTITYYAPAGFRLINTEDGVKCKKDIVTHVPNGYGLITEYGKTGFGSGTSFYLNEEILTVSR